MSGKSTDLETRRLAALREHVVAQALAEAEQRLGELSLEEAVVLVCAYEEEGAIGDVLAKIPDTACGRPLTTLVIVDGGEDRTAEIAEKSGATTIVFPVNLGHGVALKVGYRFCIDRGAKWVVTIDADGQNDPDEIPVLLQPVIDDETDFVVASRRLGTDHTTDSMRKAGVVFFSTMMNWMTGANLTDTSNGYRALRVTMLADVIDRLVQEQYQTAELLITCLKRGWRVTERPTQWHPRQAGTTKKGSNWLFGFRYLKVVLQTWLRER
jgi:glycosyltransferase involved in cell wall biosynthesis